MARIGRKVCILLLVFSLILPCSNVSAKKKYHIKSICGKNFSNSKSIAKVLKKEGFDAIHIAGVIGNFAVESHLNPSQLEIGGGCQGHGLMQVSTTSGSYWNKMIANWSKIKDDAGVQTAWLIDNFAPKEWEKYKKQQFSDPVSAADYFTVHLEGGTGIYERELCASEYYKIYKAQLKKKKKKEAAEKRRKELMTLKTIEELHLSNLTVEDVKKGPNTYSIFTKEYDIGQKNDVLNLFCFNLNEEIELSW